MTAASPTWPVALLTGFLGSGKTTLVRALLARDGMADTMVVVNEFGAVGIDHDLIAAVHGDVVLLRGGCLCCGVRQDLARTLRDLHVGWHTGRTPPFARVVVETSGLAEPGTVVATLLAHPLVRDAYALRSVTTLIDAEHGPAQLAAHATARRQVAAADRVLISKPDRAAPDAAAALRALIGATNPIAAIDWCRFGAADPAPFFAPTQVRRPRPPVLRAEHPDDIGSLTLTAERPLSWPSVQRFLAGLLDAAGDRLLRLKGILDVAGEDRPVVVQAVHHCFYPLEALPAWPAAGRASTLVLIAVGALPETLAADFVACAALE
jgi:G3E family GTPase